jgi:hypothetical protein
MRTGEDQTARECTWGSSKRPGAPREIGRDQYYSPRAELVAAMSSMAVRLGAAEYDAERALRRSPGVGDVMPAGDPGQQRRVLTSVFERVELRVESGGLAKVVPRP